jgi:hypothetical protein
VIVIDNGSYGTIRMHQEREYPGRVSATDLANPDFAALARAFGGWAERVETADEFAPRTSTPVRQGLLQTLPDESTARAYRRPDNNSRSGLKFLRIERQR